MMGPVAASFFLRRPSAPVITRRQAQSNGMQGESGPRKKLARIQAYNAWMKRTGGAPRDVIEKGEEQVRRVVDYRLTNSNSPVK